MILTHEANAYRLPSVNSYLANLARRRRQHITVNANNGKPNIQDTIGTTIDSGVTEIKALRSFESIYTRIQRNKECLYDCRFILFDTVPTKYVILLILGNSAQ